ncbi:uncharacterized protein [Aegilops tauschii subsp. strangulata]|uniref:uncharacterized protein n=1 Tax=Aegilops tauschii subsp. strangulata TaxID=200361 RepID=UPI00098A05EE
MASYRFLVQQLSGYFEGCEFLHVPRNENEPADALAWIDSTHQAIPVGVSLQCLRKPSIKPSPESESIFMPAPPEAVGSNSGAAAAGSRATAAGPGTSAGGTGTAAVAPSPGTPQHGPGAAAVSSGTATVAPGQGTSQLGPGAAAVGSGTSTMQQAATNFNPPPPNPTALVQVAIVAVEEIQAPSWAQPILKFLVNRELLADEISARQVQRRAGAYTIVNRELVRCSMIGVFQRCVEPEKGQAILKDIHQGE